ncbi:MAG: hypothetical protein LKM39_14495 [Chiayiivirga sp.]|nr:hypothetical protein [Chiayiivirga sp.]
MSPVEKASLALEERLGIPAVFCWTKMGSEAGQPLADIIRRKELERECGEGVFAWGIGNSVGPALKHAKTAERVPVIEALFTAMKSAPKAIDVAPASVVLWLGYLKEGGDISPLPEHMLITSRGHSETGEEKRAHYALMCRSSTSLMSRPVREAIDHRAVRNLVSSNPVGASQVTSVVRYRQAESGTASYPVLFRAELTAQAFVRLVMPVTLTGDLLMMYRELCLARQPQQWHQGIRRLKSATCVQWPCHQQSTLFT